MHSELVDLLDRTAWFFCAIIKQMKHAVEMIEGPEAYACFLNVMRDILAVPHAVVKERVEAARKESAANPKRRGPKPKVKPRASIS